MEILNTFGIRWDLLAAQVVNFLILLFILNRFMYKPILGVLKQRQDKIAKSLKDADEIEKRLQKTEEDREKALTKAAEEARQILDEATKSATQIVDDAHKKAQSDIEKMLEKGRQGIEQERQKMQQEIREDLADLVVIGLEKVAGKVLTQKDQKDIVERTIKDL